MVSEIDLEPRLFEFVPHEAQLTSAPSRSAPTDRPHVGSVSYLLLFALIAAAIIGIFFGAAIALLTPPKDHTVVAAGPVSLGEEEAVSTAKATPSPGDPPATIVTSARTAPVQDPTSDMPDSLASPPQVNSSATAAEFAGPGAPTRSASGGSRSRAHTAIRRGQSAHHYRQPPAQAEKQRILSAPMDRAHRENSAEFLPVPHASESRGEESFRAAHHAPDRTDQIRPVIDTSANRTALIGQGPAHPVGR